jgi:hypothetical protein
MSTATDVRAATVAIDRQEWNMPAKNQSDTEFGPAKNLAMNREWVMKVTIPAK